MTPRIQQLREDSLKAVNRISAERALLVTEFHKTDLAQQVLAPVRRALSLKYILENKSICMNQDELIVGERGPAPKATPTYPEITLHSLADLDILNSREKVFFRVDEETRKAYENIIIPFWKGKTQRDLIFDNLDENWKDAYHAGMFTEFMEQRAPGHTVNGDKIYSKGLLDIIEDIKQAILKIDFYADPSALHKLEELKAMKISAEALIHFAERHAKILQKMALSETRDWRKKELLELAEICHHVPAHAPRSFHEAIQYYWFVHLAVITELNPWDSFNPGRLDQHLYPFFKREKENGTLTEDKAKEILHSFWIKFNNHPAPPKIGVTAQESNTYTDFSLINLGGVKR